ncbi:MAG: cupin domain-containing protein [Chloroflexi bacterium]|nr:cupin domain-containing protein [Chloroflexota bacterium]
MQAQQVARLREFDSKRFVSKLIFDSEKMRVVLFCLKAGQEVSPHSAPSEVLFHCIEGQGEAIVGDEKVDLAPGSLVDCPPQMPHGLVAETDLVVVAVIAPRPG